MTSGALTKEIEFVVLIATCSMIKGNLRGFLLLIKVQILKTS